MSIQAKDLRIGNWVSYVEDANKYKDYHQVTDINTEVQLCHNGDVETELFPIELTTDILLKCGFRKVSNTYCLYENLMLHGSKT